MEMVRFVNSGTEATMSAIRLARAATKRDLIVKCIGCYHGHVDGLLVQAGSGALTLGTPSSPGIPESTTRNTISVAYNDLDATKKVFEQYRQSRSPRSWSSPSRETWASCSLRPDISPDCAGYAIATARC